MHFSCHFIELTYKDIFSFKYLFNYMNSLETTKSLLSSPVSDIIEKHPIKKTLFESFLPTFDHKEWLPLVQKMKKHYDKILIKIGGKLYLPRGTKLYHGSTEYPFLGNNPNIKRITFFGLDIDISIWYILELVRLEHFKKRDNFSQYGFLYLFTLTEDLEIHKLIELINTNPKDTRKCGKVGNVCLHPQVVFRGTTDDSPNIYKLSSEVTLHYPVYESQLSLDRVYVIDPLVLEQNKLDREWNVRNAVIRRYQNLDNLKRDIGMYSDTLDAKTYIKNYLSPPKGSLKKKRKKKTKRKSKKKI